MFIRFIGVANHFLTLVANSANHIFVNVLCLVVLRLLVSRFLDTPLWGWDFTQAPKGKIHVLSSTGTRTLCVPSGRAEGDDWRDALIERSEL